jgi:hypothetical protein
MFLLRREERVEIEFLAVAQNVRVRVRGRGQVGVSDELPDLRPRPALVVKEADPPVSEIVGGELRNS